MKLEQRLRTLECRVPQGRKGRLVPDDPVAFARKLLAGEFGPDDLDPSHPNHTGWLVRVYAFLTTLLPEHQQWLTANGIERPTDDSDRLAALDAVMRRG